jgi:DNA-binding response OmpR family regulator
MSCESCDALREEIAYLKGELALSLSEDKVARLRRSTGLTPSEVKILLTLYEARGRFCAVYMLDEAAPATISNDRNLKHIDVRICRIRKKIGKACIENAWGLGYRISDVGRLVVEEALEARARAA